MKQLKVMIIGAHPDDCDIECGGLALKYVKAGHKVKFLSLCNGNGGHHTMTAEETRVRRRGESLSVAKFAGIEYDVWEDSSDCELMATLEARARLVRDIRNYSPDIIITCRPNDYHADHRNASILVQDASYLLIVPLYCPDTPAMKKTPTILYNFDNFHNPPFKPTILVDIDDVIDDKYKMLSLHESQMYEWLPFTNDALDTVPQDSKERFEWMRSPRVPRDGSLSDAEIASMKPTGCSSQNEYKFARQASIYRDKLIERYGEKGKKTIFAEAFEVCEYGSAFSDELIPF